MMTLRNLCFGITLATLASACAEGPSAPSDVEIQRNALITFSGSMADVRGLHSIALLPDGRVLVAGGFSDYPTYTNQVTSAEIYDPATGTWSSAGSMSVAGEGRTATVLGNGKVLVTGGFQPRAGGWVFAICELYDPATNTWAPTAAMNTPRGLHTATLLADGRVLVAGGIKNVYGDGTNLAEIYDPATGTWSPGGVMGSTRTSHAAILLPNGKVLIGGGELSSGGYATTATELYDPVTNSWTPAGALSSGHNLAAMALLGNGKIILTGGRDFFANTGGTTAELYDPATGLWTLEGHIPGFFWHYYSLIAIPSGEAMIIGGTESEGVGIGTPLKRMAVFDPPTGQWYPTEDLKTTRAYHASVLLPNGKILVTGGFANTLSAVGLSSTELITPGFSLGVSCTNDSDCLSQFCTDGVCCSRRCDGDCEACSVASGAQMTGTCSALAAGTSCRPASGDCDLAEVCDGVDGGCPQDLVAQSGTTCREAVGECDVAEACDGASASCPSDALADAGTVCRGPAGVCDLAEVCDGTSGSCPADAVATIGTLCRVPAGVCDLAEACDGASVSCPPDAVAPIGTMCRAAAGECDVIEVCDGANTACPADVSAPDGTLCTGGGSCVMSQCVPPVEDAGVVDSGVPDAGSADAGPTDAGSVADSGTPMNDDAGVGTADDGGSAADGGLTDPISTTGCGCGTEGGSPLLAMFSLLGAVLLRRRRHSVQRVTKV